MSMGDHEVREAASRLLDGGDGEKIPIWVDCDTGSSLPCLLPFSITSKQREDGIVLSCTVELIINDMQDTMYVQDRIYLVKQR
jgi:hypothetical protein